MMKNLVDFLAKSLVDYPDKVVVKEIAKDNNTMVYELRVAQTDIGKVIGKKGRTAQALRTLLAAAGNKQNKRTELEIIE